MIIKYFLISNISHWLLSQVVYLYLYSDSNEKLSKHFLCFVFSYPSITFVIFHCSHQPAIIIVFHYLPLNVWKWSISSPEMSKIAKFHFNCRVKLITILWHSQHNFKKYMIQTQSNDLNFSEISSFIDNCISVKDSINPIWFHLNSHLLVHIVLTHHAQQ